MNPRVFVISGPSGVGKSTIIKKTMEELPQLSLSVSHTTREPRDGEVEGRDYHFIGRDDFERMIGEGGFLESAEVYGNYYGTSQAHVQSLLDAGRHALLDVDTQGAMNIKAICSGVLFFFIKPPSLGELEVRLRKRASETDASLYKRLSQAEHEISFSTEYDHVIVNDDVGRAVEELVTLLREAEQEPIPFVCSPGHVSAPENELGDEDFLRHLRNTLEARIKENFSLHLADSIRAELQELINSHLDSVLEKELSPLLKNLLSTPRKSGD